MSPRQRRLSAGSVWSGRGAAMGEPSSDIPSTRWCSSPRVPEVVAHLLHDVGAIAFCTSCPDPAEDRPAPGGRSRPARRRGFIAPARRDRCSDALAAHELIGQSWPSSLCHRRAVRGLPVASRLVRLGNSRSADEHGLRGLREIHRGASGGGKGSVVSCASDATHPRRQAVQEGEIMIGRRRRPVLAFPVLAVRGVGRRRRVEGRSGRCAQGDAHRRDDRGGQAEHSIRGQGPASTSAFPARRRHLETARRHPHRRRLTGSGGATRAVARSTVARPGEYEARLNGTALVELYLAAAPAPSGMRWYYSWRGLSTGMASRTVWLKRR